MKQIKIITADKIEDIEKQVNEFIKGIDVIDIKMQSFPVQVPGKLNNSLGIAMLFCCTVIYSTSAK